MEENIPLELRKISNIMKRTFDTFCGNKITYMQSVIVNFIVDNNNLGRIVYQKDIEELFSIRRSSVSELVNGMEKNKLIKRCLNNNDLRSKEIHLDVEGEKFYKEFQKIKKRIEKIIEKDISESELEIFCLVLKKVRKNLEELC